MAVIVFLVSLVASIVGAICGIGGGVIIKPVLDVCQIAGVTTISFLSGCTVLSMSGYSIAKGLLSKDCVVDFKIGTPLAVGAAMGGVLGKQLFNAVKNLAENPNMVGCIQASCLAIITIGTLVYTLNKHRIKTYCVHGFIPCMGIGAVLGVMSSFLGIGGGPINLVVLYFFFSMSTKVAAQNSLYIILISQIASLMTTFVTNTVPDVTWLWLILMIAGGIGGGVIGRKINKHINAKRVEQLFVGLMGVIILISCYNVWVFARK